MTKKGREFNEIYDLTAMRVIVDSVKDCYGAVGVIHSLWKPLPGRFKDFIAMPKFNMYQSLHTTVIGPEGLPLEIQIRTREMHDMAEFGVAAHWIYKDDGGKSGPAADGRGEAQVAALDARLAAGHVRTPKEFMEALKVDLFEDEVFVFTPKGEVKSLAAGATPLDFAYEVHTDVGHRCVGAKVNGKMVPLHYELKSGDIVEVLTSNRERGPSRDWLAVVQTTRARNKIKQWFKAESRDDTEHAGRELLQEQLKKRGLPPQKIVSSPLLADVIREMGFKKADDFYIALGGAKISREDRRQQGHAAPQAGRGGRGRDSARRRGHALDAPPAPPADELRRRSTASPSRASTTSCCASPSAAARCRATRSSATSRSAAASRSTARTARTPSQLRKDPERFTPVQLGGRATRRRSRSSCRSTPGTATACSRTSRGRSPRPASTSSRRAASSRTRWSRTGSSSRSATCRSSRHAITRLRNIDSVFDAYRVTPGGG